MKGIILEKFFSSTVNKAKIMLDICAVRNPKIILDE